MARSRSRAEPTLMARSSQADSTRTDARRARQRRWSLVHPPHLCRHGGVEIARCTETKRALDSLETQRGIQASQVLHIARHHRRHSARMRPSPRSNAMSAPAPMTTVTGNRNPQPRARPVPRTDPDPDPDPDPRTAGVACAVAGSGTDLSSRDAWLVHAQSVRAAGPSEPARRTGTGAQIRSTSSVASRRRRSFTSLVTTGARSRRAIRTTLASTMSRVPVCPHKTPAASASG
jgi:hypothetical protein